MMRLPSVLFASSFVFQEFLANANRITTFLAPQFQSGRHRCRHETNMVRNIDLPEAIIFYGVVNFQADDGSSLLPGVQSLLKECHEVKSAAILIIREGEIATISTCANTEQLHVFNQGEFSPPNPTALWKAIHQVTIQPKGFGGSSGFGRKAADPDRPPMAKHVVVLCNDENVCRAARFMGMRVICRSCDNDLADAIVTSWDEFGIDDIATPGSFWLNPPQPRDDDGNRVDPLDVMSSYQSATGSLDNAATEFAMPQKSPSLDLDSELAKILEDLDPL